MILASVLLSCAPVQRERVFDPTSGSTLSAPLGWRVEETPEALVLVATDDPPDGASCNLRVSAYPSWAGFTALQHREALSTAEIAASPGVTILDERWTPIGNQDAQRLVMDFDQVRPEGTALVRVLRIRIPRDEKLVQLTCTSHRSTFEQRLPTFEAILDSWVVR